MKKKSSTDHQRRRDDLLRPSHYLGYDHDTIGVYTFNRRAFGIAEAEFRRAIWLNPFEPKFKVHLAWSLYSIKKLAEAREWVIKSLKQDSKNKEALELLKLIKGHLKGE